MNKVKSISSSILPILKSVLIGLVVTLVGIVAFAVVLKFADVNSHIVSYVNDVIKAVALFFTVFVLKKKGVNQLLVKSIIAGVVYALLSYVIFSILNGGFVFNVTFLYDLIFAVIVAAVASVILSLCARK